MDPERPADAAPTAWAGVPGARTVDMAIGAEDGHRAALRADLAHAMRAAARTRHGRLVSDADERQAAYLSALHARAAAEVDGLRAANEQDALAVEAWATSEVERLETERERRLSVVRGDLQTRLEAHEARLQAEIARVERAVRSYRAELGSFFERLDAEADPTAIAAMAARVPLLAPLDEADAADDAETVARPVDESAPQDGQESVAASVLEPVIESEPAPADALETMIEPEPVAEAVPELVRESEPEPGPAAGADPVPEPDGGDEVDDEGEDEGHAPVIDPDEAMAEPAPEEDPIPPVRLPAWWEVPHPVSTAAVDAPDPDAAFRTAAVDSLGWDVPAPEATTGFEPAVTRPDPVVEQAPEAPVEPPAAPHLLAGALRPAMAARGTTAGGVSNDPAPRPTNSAERVRARLHFIAEHRASLASADGTGSTASSGQRG